MIGRLLSRRKELVQAQVPGGSERMDQPGGGWLLARLRPGSILKRSRAGTRSRRRRGGWRHVRQQRGGLMDDQIVATNLERTPSLLDGLESGWYVEGGVAARYQFAVDLDCYLATPGVAGSPMADEMRVAIELPDEGSRALPDVAGLAGRVRDFLRLRREQVTGQQQFELPLVAYEMWVPPVTGATASATRSAAPDEWRRATPGWPTYPASRCGGSFP
jgi:hypothetical protein